MSAAFVCWNPFQFLHFLPVVAEMPDSVMVVEARPKHVDALHDQLIDQCPVPVLFWPSGRMHELDGVFDVVVCQTRFRGLERFRRTPVAMLMYGLAKEAYNYGDWRSLAQLQLVYGEHSRAKMHPHGEVAVVGNPRFDRWHDPGFHEAARKRHRSALAPGRPTILYAPTWGTLSSVDRYLGAVVALARDYNLLLKVHHNTHLVERARASACKTSMPHVFGAEDDLLELLSVSDLVLSDYSGAVFDALCAERPLVLLHDPNPPFGEKLDETSIEHAARTEIGLVVCEPADLQAAVQTHFHEPSAYRSRNEALRRRLFLSEPGAAKRAASTLTLFAERSRSQKAIGSLPETRAVNTRRSKSFALARLRTRLPSAPRVYAAALRSLRAARPQLVRDLSRIVRSPVPLVLTARAASEARNQHVAFELLRHAQRHFPANRWVITALTELHRGDGAIDKARATLKLEQLLDPIQGGLRGLALETSVGDVERAEALFDRLLPRLSPQLTSQHLGALFRTAAPLEGRARQLREFRGRLSSDASSVGRADASSPATIEGALRVRALPLARVSATPPASPRSPRLMSALRAHEQVRQGLGNLEGWAELAWHNESTQRLHVVDAGRTDWTELDATVAPSGKRLVDFYIPTPFFDYANRKPTTQTVREAFRALGEALSRRDDVAVVPRLQFNWRAVTPEPQRPALSYHTHERVRSNRLHVQEAALAGRISIDALGYAGYSSAALQPELVEHFAETRTDVQRRTTFNELSRIVVTERNSKYTQPSGETSFTGAYVFLPMQVVTDPVATLSWADSVTMLRVAAEALKGSGVRLVVKRHPYCQSLGVARALHDLEREGTVTVAEASIHDLISEARAVLTVNSGVGLEALVHGKPVIVTGRSVYGYAAQVATDAATMTTLLRDPPAHDMERTTRFLDYYMHVHTMCPNERDRVEMALEDWVMSW